MSVDGTELVTLAAGQSHQFRRFGRDAGAMITGGRITSTKPVLLLQFMQYGTYQAPGSPSTTGDPAMSVIPPFEQFQTSYTLATMADGFAYNAVNVVIPTAAVASFRLNDAAVADGSFVALGSTGFSGAQLAIAPGTYRLSASQPFGVFLYGANPANSYAVPGGMSLAPVALISTLTLGSGVSTGTIEDAPSVCFTATVRDSGGGVLAGIRVDFALAGVLTDVGAATTDESGVATYCAVNTSDAGGTVAVTATVASLTAAGDRTIPAPGMPAGGDGGGGGGGGTSGGPSPVPDPGGDLPTSTPPGSTSGSVGGVPTAPTPSVPTTGTASYQVGVVQAQIQVGGAGTVSGPGTAPVIQVVRDRVGTVGGGGMAPGGIVEVWMPLPGGGSRQVALLPVGPDGTFNGALPFTGELDGQGPLPIGERTIQLFGTDANGQLTVINVGIRVQQPGPLAPEPERAPGAPPTLSPGQSLATNAGLPTPVTVTPLVDSRTARIAGDGWLLDIAVPEGTLRDEAGNPIFEIVLGDRTAVNGSGFLPGTRAYVWLMSTPRFLGEVTIRPDGTFAGSLPVNGVTVGPHTLQVSGVGTDGYIRAANLGVIVTGDGRRPTGVRAGEGTDGLLPLQLAGLLAAGLAGIAAATRTRRRSLT